MRRFAKFTYLALARCCSSVLLELDVLICAGLISFAAYWPATGQQDSVSSSYVVGAGCDFRTWFRTLVSFPATRFKLIRIQPKQVFRLTGRVCNAQQGG
jgi:hypothetical protein